MGCGGIESTLVEGWIPHHSPDDQEVMNRHQGDCEYTYCQVFPDTLSTYSSSMHAGGSSSSSSNMGDFLLELFTVYFSRVEIVLNWERSVIVAVMDC